MPARSLISAEFESLIKDNKLVFIYYWAGWCAPCKVFSDVYEQISEQFPDIVFAKVNIEEQQDLTEFFELRSIPHLMVFKDGIIIYSNAGSLSRSTLNELVGQAIDVDVSDIRAQLEEESVQ